jgi:hypothetical protein
LNLRPFNAEMSHAHATYLLLNWEWSFDFLWRVRTVLKPVRWTNEALIFWYDCCKPSFAVLLYSIIWYVSDEPLAAWHPSTVHPDMLTVLLWLTCMS